MRASWPITLVLLTALQAAAYCQNASTDQLAEISRLERHAEPYAAITLGKRVLEQTSLTAGERGTAWTLIGLAYTDVGATTDSIHAYEQALRFLHDKTARAAALDDLGAVYLSTGQMELSKKCRTRALDLYRSAQDHVGLAIVNNNLAAIAFAEQKVSKGAKFLQEAKTQASQTTGLSSDDLAAISSLDGYLERTLGHKEKAVDAYRRALELWKEVHPEDHPAVGWGEISLAVALDEAGLTQQAVVVADQAIKILSQFKDSGPTRLVSAEFAYSRILRDAGKVADAAKIHRDAEAFAQNDLHRACTGCTISVAVFR